MKKIILKALILLVVVFFHSNAFALVEFEGRYWFSNLDSTVKVTAAGFTGTEIDLVDDLGVGDTENFFEGRITLGLGGHKIRYAFVPLSFDGEKTITKTIVFGGSTYAITMDVKSNLDIAYHRLSYRYDIIDTLGNRLGVIVEAKLFDIDAELVSSGAGISEEESIMIPLPAIGVAAQAGLPFLFTVGGEITGVSAGSNGYVVDAEASVNFKPAPLVQISGGYRYLDLHAETSDDKVDLTIDGPFVMVRVGF